jgi:hypothetical protein
MIPRFICTLIFCCSIVVGFSAVQTVAPHALGNVDGFLAYIAIYVVLGFVARCVLGSAAWALAAVVCTGFVDGASAPTVGALAARRTPSIDEISGPWALLSVLAGLVRGTIVGAIGVVAAALVQLRRVRR